MSPFLTRIPEWHDEALARIEELEALAIELRDALRRIERWANRPDEAAQNEPMHGEMFGKHTALGRCAYQIGVIQEVSERALAKANKELGD